MDKIVLVIISVITAVMFVALVSMGIIALGTVLA